MEDQTSEPELPDNSHSILSLLRISGASACIQLDWLCSVPITALAYVVDNCSELQLKPNLSFSRQA
jgi:hypothetical protein